ncbi:MAG: hypothetical protein DWQ10_16315, partial [Calditrichaeota bacterium]
MYLFAIFLPKVEENDMDRLHIKIFILSLLTYFILACSASKTNLSEYSSAHIPGYNKLAMELTIRASIQEVLGNDAQALHLYQEAKRYDSTSAGLDLAIS